jgi:hypothetical protein
MNVAFAERSGWSRARLDGRYEEIGIRGLRTGRRLTGSDRYGAGADIAEPSDPDPACPQRVLDQAEPKVFASASLLPLG